MDFSVRKIIGELPIAVVVKATGLPFSTVWRWWDEDRIPGKPHHVAHQMKKERLERAVAAVKLGGGKSKKRRAA